MLSSLEIFDLATGPRVVLQSDRRIEAPNWHPSGTYLLVNAEGLLYRVPLDAPDLLPLDTGFAKGCNNDHGFSPDGTRLILSNHRGQGAEMFILPANGGEPVLISPEPPSWFHGFAPDGKAITYVAARGGRRVIDVYTMALDGGPELRLTRGEGHCDGPEFSADGAMIYYNCDRGGHAQIWVMNRDGTGQRPLFTDHNVNWFPHPSPDGRHLIFLAYPPGTLGHPRDLAVAIRRCDPDGGSLETLVTLTGGQGTMNVPNWSPDSRAFAFVRYADPAENR
jgi:Tol biopolymer transport system component